MAGLEGFSQTRVVGRGETVFLSGDPAASVFFLTSGRVKIVRLSDDGKEFIFDLVEPGQSFGESGIFDDGPREASAETMERCTLLSVPAVRLRYVLRRNATALVRLVGILGERQKKLERKLVDLAYKNAPRRFAALLVELSQSYGVRDARGTLLRVKLNQSILGSLLGVSREIVNHALADLRRRGVIDLVEGRLIVRDLQALARGAGRNDVRFERHPGEGQEARRLLQ